MGLPGNPVSALVIYLLFVAPAVERLGGQPPSSPLVLNAKLEHSLTHTPGRREYVRGAMRTQDDELIVRATGDQSSNRIATFAAANCLIVAKEDADELPSGTSVGVIPISGETAHLLATAES